MKWFTDTRNNEAHDGGMIARAGQQARLPIAALAALALLAFIAFSSLPRSVATPAASVTQSSAPAVTRTLAQRPLPVQANPCADGTAYVTGDMVGEASPAAVYAKVCL